MAKEPKPESEGTGIISAPTVTGDVFRPAAEVFAQIGSDIRKDLFGLLRRPLPGSGKSAPSDFRTGRTSQLTARVGPPAPPYVGEILPRQEQIRENMRRAFVERYNEAENSARQREFTSVPLGYSPTMYEVVTRPIFGDVEVDGETTKVQVGETTVYRLKDWYKTPLEEAAMSVARMDPTEGRAMFDPTFQDREQQMLATPTGRRQLLQMSGQEDRYVSVDPTITSGPTKLLTQEDAIDIVSRMGVDELNGLKDSLIRVGALKEKDAGTRMYADRTAGTYQAFADVVQLAQGNARTWHSLLSEALDQNIVLFDNNASSSPPRMIRLTAPEDLGAVFGQTALRTIGRRLTDEETQFMVTSYQDMERSFGRQAALGGEVVDAPSPQAFAETRISDQIGEEYDVFQMGNVLDDFRRILGGQL
jgi:hypothetical protein